MNRRKFMIATSGTLGAFAITSNSNQLWAGNNFKIPAFHPESNFNKLDETHLKILHYASLAPSSHNVQPWTVKVEDYNTWIIGIDSSRCLPAVDPTRREMYLSLGTFLENMILAAGTMGVQINYNVQENDTELLKIGLKKAAVKEYPLQRLQLRRTIKTGHQIRPLAKSDQEFLLKEVQYAAYYPFISAIADKINQLSVEANQLQVNRDDAQRELAEWIRFSKKEAHENKDGLTPASMEINGLARFFVQTFYNKSTVMKESFRKQTVEITKNQVEQCGGWLVCYSENNSKAALIETGRRFERVALKAREKKIALHPISQAIEELPERINQALPVQLPVQFLVRASYIDHYPEPVSLRREVMSFVN